MTVPAAEVPKGPQRQDRLPAPSIARIAHDLDAIARIGGDPRGPVSRLAHTGDERRAHEAVRQWMREAGLTVVTDAFGNTIGERAGRFDLPGLVVGSHLDSVPNGGRFDGIVGVVAGLEVMRLLGDAGIATDHPVRVVAFANEEGARFGEACLGSKAVVGAIGPADAERLRDLQGVTLGAAMRALDLDPDQIGDAAWPTDHVAAYLELHIEQGRILEEEGLPIGIVDWVAGNKRMRIGLEGQAGHSGATPMARRRDALAAAAELTLGVERIASSARTTVGTIGQLDVIPNNITTVPGAVRLSVDVRDIDAVRQRDAARAIASLANEIAARRGISVVIDTVSDTPPSLLHLWVRKVIGGVCRELELLHRTMPSGAGHDAQIVARRFPSGLIFVPSRDGASHVPEEWTSVEDIAVGVRVLAESLLELDRSASNAVEASAAGARP